MKKLLYSLLALPMLMVACGEEVDTPTPEPSKPTLELTSEATMEFEAEGGEGTITFVYDFTGAVENQENLNSNQPVVAIDCDAEWIDVANEVYAYATSFTFVVAPNEVEEPREAVVKASILDLSFEVTIKQAAAQKSEDEGNQDDDENENDDPVTIVEGWAINGTMNDWDKSKAIAMTVQEDYFAVKGVTLTEDDAFNFIFDGGQQTRGGDGSVAEPNYVYAAKSAGSNIRVSEDGVYDIYLSSSLDKYYIMSEGNDPSDAEEPVKPGETVWSVFGNFEGNDCEKDIVLKSSGKYFVAKGLKFVGDKTFAVRRNGGDEGVWGAISNDPQSVESEIQCIKSQTGSRKIVMNVEEGVAYDIYFIYDDFESKVWVMPQGMTPVIWKSVEGCYFHMYNNFLIYFVTQDVELSLDFTAGVEVDDYVVPEGVYYINDVDETGFCFDLEYCIAKVRGQENFMLSGTMTVSHLADGKYDINIDMKTIQQNVLRMHYVGEIGFDPFFANMGGTPINGPK